MTDIDSEPSGPGWTLFDPLSGPDPASEGPGPGEVVGEAAWLHAMVETECAFSLALVEESLAPEWMRDVVTELLRPGRYDPARIASQARGGGNAAIPLAAALAADADALHAGAADYIHVGVTSQDVIDTALMIMAQRAARALTDSLTKAADAAACLAERHAATPMAARTLGQHAVPTSFGLVVAGWLTRIDAARAALDRLAQHLPLQLGGAAGTTAVLHAWIERHAAMPTSVRAVQDRAAASLGLVNPPLPWHTDRLPLVSCADVFARAAEVAGSIATQVAVLSRTEIAEVAERLTEGEGVSSTMPHKQNPVTATLIIAAAMRIPGLVAGVHAGMLAEDQRPMGAWHAQWAPFRDILAIALETGTALATLLGRLRVDAHRMVEDLERTQGLVYSGRARAALAPFLGEQRAFTLVRSATQAAVEAARPLAETLDHMLPYDLPEKVHADVASAFHPDEAVAVTAETTRRIVAQHRDETAGGGSQPDRSSTGSV
jgi:3-carboxy-cis,cis-muconate cycloisomerase